MSAALRSPRPATLPGHSAAALPAAYRARPFAFTEADRAQPPPPPLHGRDNIAQDDDAHVRQLLEALRHPAVACGAPSSCADVWSTCGPSSFAAARRALHSPLRRNRPNPERTASYPRPPTSSSATPRKQQQQPRAAVHRVSLSAVARRGRWPNFSPRSSVGGRRAGGEMHDTSAADGRSGQGRDEK